MSQRLIIPENLWSQLENLYLSNSNNLENIAFLDGILFNTIAIATSLIIPNAELSPYNYHVSTHDMIECGELIRADRLQRVAQVHTHPSSNVKHSPYDDENAYSHADNAISIVVPHYGRRGTDIKSCGIHLCMDGKWKQVSNKEVEVQIVPSFKDYRRWPKQLEIDIKAASTDSRKSLLDWIRGK